MRFGRRAKVEDEADQVIDLRERLAPYTGEVAVLDELPQDPERALAWATPPARLRPLRAPTYQPRHLAP
jgi:hypothetical protein